MDNVKTEARGHSVTIIGGQGIISQEDFQGYWDIITDAFTIHIGKERTRQGLWKNYPAGDQYNQVRIKADRIMRSLEVIGKTPDEALVTALKEEVRSEGHDIINYITFGDRLL